MSAANKFENKEFLDLPLEIKMDDDFAAKGTFSGYASVFGSIDSYYDVVVKGAFAKSLQARKGKIMMLYQHSSDKVIGKFTEIKEDDYGLYVEGRISDTSIGRDVRTLLMDGALNGMSIGFYTKKAEEGRQGQPRKLLEVDLIEISVVTFPANDKATISQVKAADRQSVDQELDLLATVQNLNKILTELRLTNDCIRKHHAG